MLKLALIVGLLLVLVLTALSHWAPTAAVDPSSAQHAYLIHQQGTRGAEEHVNHPDRIAWKSMCATDEGKQKGEKWCKQAIWGNTLPEIKHVWKTVDNLTSGAFVKMWQQQVDRYYTRYSETATN